MMAYQKRGGTWRPEPQSVVWIFITEGVARATIPYAMKDVIKQDIPDAWFDGPSKLWAFRAEWVSYLTTDLRALGYTVRVVQDRPHAHASGSPGAQRRTWAAGMFEALSPELAERAYRALSRVLHPDAGGDGRQQQVLNDAWGKARPKAGAR